MESKKVAKAISARLKKNATIAEKKLKKELLKRHIKFQFQKPVPKITFDRGFYIPDFTIRVRNNKHYNLYIEIDGGYHTTKEQRIKDLKRERFLTSGPHLLIRFTNEDIYKRIDRVIQEIEYKIGNRVIVK